MKQFLFSLIALLGLAISLPAKAAGRSSGGFFIDETFLPIFVSRNEEDVRSFNTAPGTATESGFGYDLRSTVGYVFDNRLVVGLTYNMYSLSTNRSAVSGGNDGREEKSSRSELGPTIGYMPGAWRFLLTYFISGSREFSSVYKDSAGVISGDTTFKNSHLSGFQLTFGYSYALGSRFELGPSLVYKSLTYANQAKTNRLTPAEDYEDSALYSKLVDASLTPMISMTLRF